MVTLTNARLPTYTEDQKRAAERLDSVCRRYAAEIVRDTKTERSIAALNRAVFSFYLLCLRLGIATEAKIIIDRWGVRPPELAKKAEGYYSGRLN